MIPIMRFEEKLRKQMILKGLNQQRLAASAGVSNSEVSRILGGKSQPGLTNAIRLARAVGVSLDYLADDDLYDDGAASAETPGERAEVLEVAGDLGYRQARHLLESARILGYEVAIRRLHGAEMKPLIEVAPPPASRSIQGAGGVTSALHGSTRASSA